MVIIIQGGYYLFHFVDKFSIFGDRVLVKLPMVGIILKMIYCQIHDLDTTDKKRNFFHKIKRADFEKQ